MLLVNAPGQGSQYLAFFGGFVSIIMTIAAMGRQARKNPARLSAAGAGASFSSIATNIELLVILVMTNIQLLRYLRPGVTGMGLVAAIYGWGFALWIKMPATTAELYSGRAFEPKHAFLFAGAFALMLATAALLQRLLGSAGAKAVVSVSGFFDAHVATASAARLASSGALAVGPASFAALLAITANTAVNAIVAVVVDGLGFALTMCPSHAAMLAALCCGWLLIKMHTP